MTETKGFASVVNEYLGIVASIVFFLSIVVTMAVSISGRATVKDLNLVKSSITKVRLDLKDKEDKSVAKQRDERLRLRLRSLENRCSRIEGRRRK